MSKIIKEKDKMNEENLLKAHAVIKLVELYGVDYLKEKLKTCWCGVCDEKDACRFIFLMESLGGNCIGKNNKKCWKTYAIIDVDKITFEATVIDFVKR
ncbi:MAG: hypothetical protein E7600_09420 [Ruminococcaceae bacterium]|nr:hypothetical protein [Oscillospiraceae bacterium]